MDQSDRYFLLGRNECHQEAVDCRNISKERKGTGVGDLKEGGPISFIFWEARFSALREGSYLKRGLEILLKKRIFEPSEQREVLPARRGGGAILAGRLSSNRGRSALKGGGIRQGAKRAAFLVEKTELGPKPSKGKEHLSLGGGDGEENRGET